MTNTNVISMSVRRASLKGSQSSSQVNARKNNVGTLSGLDRRPKKEVLVPSRAMSAQDRGLYDGFFSSIAMMVGFESARLLDDLMMGVNTPHTACVGSLIEEFSAEEALKARDVFALIASIIRPADVSGPSRIISLATKDHFEGKKAECQATLGDLFVSSGWAPAIFWGVVLGVVDPMQVVENKKLSAKEAAKLVNVAAFARQVEGTAKARLMSYYGGLEA